MSWVRNRRINGVKLMLGLSGAAALLSGCTTTATTPGTEDAAAPATSQPVVEALPPIANDTPLPPPPPPPSNGQNSYGAMNPGGPSLAPTGRKIVGGFWVTQSSGAIASDFPVGMDSPGSDGRICLSVGDRLVLASAAGSESFTGPECFRTMGQMSSALAMRRGGSSRARTGAVRGAGAFRGGSSRASLFRVRAASANVLKDYPRGTVVASRTKICLARGEQITLVSGAGRSVTYSGPGCLKRSPAGATDNSGGFTFGYLVPPSARPNNSVMAGD